MRRAATTLFTVAMLVFMVAATSSADLAAYSQDFEGLDASSPTALGDDGWVFFANVFDEVGTLLFPYGPQPAPNATVSPTDTFISAVATGEGDVPQGAQQLSVFNDYNCCQPSNGHFNGTDRVEINVFQELRSELSPITAADIGRTLTFSFDAKRGNIEGATTALAFIVTLDPAASFAQTRAHGGCLSLIFIEIDELAALRDRHGPAVGDTVLGALAPVLRGEGSGDRLVSRYGSDTFALLVPGATRFESAKLAEHLRQVIGRQRIDVGGETGPLQPTASVGVVRPFCTSASSSLRRAAILASVLSTARSRSSSMSCIHLTA